MRSCGVLCCLLLSFTAVDGNAAQCNYTCDNKVYGDSKIGKNISVGRNGMAPLELCCAECERLLSQCLGWDWDETGVCGIYWKLADHKPTQGGCIGLSTASSKPIASTGTKPTTNREAVGDREMQTDKDKYNHTKTFVKALIIMGTVTAIALVLVGAAACYKMKRKRVQSPAASTATGANLDGLSEQGKQPPVKSSDFFKFGPDTDSETIPDGKAGLRENAVPQAGFVDAAEITGTGSSTTQTNNRTPDDASMVTATA